MGRTKTKGKEKGMAVMCNERAMRREGRCGFGCCGDYRRHGSERVRARRRTRRADKMSARVNGWPSVI